MTDGAVTARQVNKGPCESSISWKIHICHCIIEHEVLHGNTTGFEHLLQSVTCIFNFIRASRIDFQPFFPLLSKLTVKMNIWISLTLLSNLAMRF